MRLVEFLPREKKKPEPRLGIADLGRRTGSLSGHWKSCDNHLEDLSSQGKVGFLPYTFSTLRERRRTERSSISEVAASFAGVRSFPLYSLQETRGIFLLVYNSTFFKNKKTRKPRDLSGAQRFPRRDRVRSALERFSDRGALESTGLSPSLWPWLARSFSFCAPSPFPSKRRIIFKYYFVNFVTNNPAYIVILYKS